MKTKLGFLLSHIGDTELAKSFIGSANKFLDDNHDVDIIVFVGNQVKPVSHPTFASMNINEAFDYDGVVVATDIMMAEKLLRFPGPSKKFYYLWGLDWMTQTNHSFEDLLEIFHHPNLSIIAKTPEEKVIIERCWNCCVKTIIPDCNVEEFVKMVRQDEN